MKIHSNLRIRKVIFINIIFKLILDFNFEFPISKIKQILKSDESNKII